jgi:polysaccharide pyruvyl transferase WcaK-like protein
MRNRPYSPKYAISNLKIIYFRKLAAFLSAFEKSDCFIYIGGEKASSLQNLNNRILEDNIVDMRKRTSGSLRYV